MNNDQAVSDDNHWCFVLSEDDHKTNRWCVDSGASSHITNNKNFFTQLNTSETEWVILANGEKVKSEGRGFGFITVFNENNKQQTVSINNVMYIPSMMTNLLSVKKLVNNGFDVIFKDKFCEISKKIILLLLLQIQ